RLSPEGFKAGKQQRNRTHRFPSCCTAGGAERLSFPALLHAFPSAAAYRGISPTPPLCESACALSSPAPNGCRGRGYASAAPSALHASSASSSGASLQMTLSQTSSAPSSAHRVSQLRIHSPSPQPYEPNRAIRLPCSPLAQAVN